MFIWLLLGVGLLMVSKLMVATLLHHTSAVPAEYSSLQKRPSYLMVVSAAWTLSQGRYCESRQRFELALEGLWALIMA